MNPALWICCFLPLIIVLLQQAEGIKTRRIQKIISDRKRGDKNMASVVENYIGKECLVYTMNSQISGTVTEVNDGWLVIDTGKGPDAVNLDYVVRVREYPKNKKGKKETIVLD